ncbi:MAG: serine/threonine-protein kinase [Planctomycetota bacterium]
MQPRDADDMRFAARLVFEGFLDQAMMQRILESQRELEERGRPMTVAQICVGKKWLTRSEARFLIAGEKPPADLVAGYRITGHLGSGGMSKVFAATRESDGLEVALKVLEPRLAHDEAQRARFFREGELLCRFHHENIVRGHELVESDGLVAIAQERVNGGELLALLEARGAFREDAALYVVLQIGRGLMHMHEQGIIHRDIKPGNVLITPDNTVKICDLGFATGAGEDAESDVTVGTVEYISPEQARGDGDLDGRTDIYALGATLYHLVVGDIPFRGEDGHETMAKRFVESLSSPKLAHVSPHVHYFIQKMMATDRELRYQDPAELVEDIEEQIRGNKSLTRDPHRRDDELDLERPFGEEPAVSRAPVPRSKRLGAGRRRKR